MLMPHPVGDALRVALLLALALLAMPILRGASSATRRLVLAMSLGGALALPVVSAAAPAWRVETPASIASMRGVMTPDPAVSFTGAPASSARSEATTASFVDAAVARGVDLGRLAWVIWATGAALVATRLLAGQWSTRRIVRRATGAPGWEHAASRAERSTGQRVDVLATSDLGAPAVAGVLSPVILVPDASVSWNDERRYVVLLHELAHVRQKDCLVQVVAQLACALYWFNPLVWLVAARLRVERELAADDAVVVAGSRPTSYAEELVAIACGAVGVAPSSALGMAEPSLLARRVVAIVSPSRLRRPPKPLATAFLTASVVAAVLLMACATPAAAGSATGADVEAARVTPSSAGAESTIDARLQSIAEEELGRAMDEWKAAAGTVLVLSPATGEVLANAGRSKGADDDVGISHVYVTGSTIKPFTLAAALEEGVVQPTDRFDCEHGAFTYRGATIRDSAPQGVLTVPEMLAVSSNIGFTKIYDRLGEDRLVRWLQAFHFTTRPAPEQASSGAGWDLAIGSTLRASPLQVAAAYAALANGGYYVAPTLARRTGDAPREAVLRPETARAVMGMLEGVVGSERATGTRARVEGERVAGKTGTAAWELPDGSLHYYSSFVGIVPSASPRYVILVGLEQPEPEQAGGIVAAPVFSRVATRAMAR